MSTAGVAVLLRVGWRTRWKGLTAWVLGLAATLAGTAASIASLYDTPAKVHSYAAAVASGALYAINGRVEGIDSFGGVVQDEFGFIAAFALPLFGIVLLAGSTRREEESGRLELLLAGRIGRGGPVLAALLLATAVLTVSSFAHALILIAVGMGAAASVLYAASLGALAAFFAALAALLAQLMLHARGVYTAGFAVLILAYVLRGVGDATGSWVTWLSPLGWQEKTAPTGDQRWWVLAIPLLLALVLGSIAVRVAVRRDLGSALLRGGTGADRARPTLRHPVGLALWLHRPAVLGWLAGAVVLAAVMGSLARQVVDAMRGNPAFAAAVGTVGRPEDAFLAMVLLDLAILGCGYAVQAVAVLRHEETAGRLEPRLAGTISRRRWLAAHGLVVAAGLVAVNVAGAVAFAVATAWSTGDAGQLGRLLRSGAAYLPAQLVLAAAAVAIFGLRPRALPLAWAVLAGTTAVAILGPGLKLPRWLLDLAPLTHVGSPPTTPVPATALAALVVVAAALVAVGFVGFRRRGVPQG